MEAYLRALFTIGDVSGDGLFSNGCLTICPGRLTELGVTEEAPAGVHLSFWRQDGCRLVFVDARLRTARTAIWNFGVWGGPWRRGPDPRTGARARPFRRDMQLRRPLPRRFPAPRHAGRPARVRRPPTDG